MPGEPSTYTHTHSKNKASMIAQLSFSQGNVKHHLFPQSGNHGPNEHEIIEHEQMAD